MASMWDVALRRTPATVRSFFRGKSFEGLCGRPWGLAWVEFAWNRLCVWQATNPDSLAQPFGKLAPARGPGYESTFSGA